MAERPAVPLSDDATLVTIAGAAVSMFYEANDGGVVPIMEKPATGGVGRLQLADHGMITVLYPELRRFAGVVGPVEVDPDDLVHDAIVQVLRTRPLSELTNPGAYLRAAIVNLAANHRRRLGRQRLAIQRLRGTSVHYDEYPSGVAELLELPSETRAAVYLSEIERWSSDAIGEVLGCSPSAVRKRVSRALADLRDRRERGGPDDAARP